MQIDLMPAGFSRRRFLFTLSIVALVAAPLSCDPAAGPIAPAVAERAGVAYRGAVANAPEPVAPLLSEELAAALAVKNPVVLGDTRLPRLSELTEAERRAIAEALRAEPIGVRVAAFLFLQIGTPYALGPLGEEAPPDTDPIIHFKSSDCVVLNLTSWAAATASAEESERKAINRAHYRGGVVSYANRFHFTTDRLDYSPMNSDITARVGGVAVRSRRMTLNTKPDGSQWIPIAWERVRVMRWIPWSETRRVPFWHREGRIPDLTGIAFVSSSLFDKGLDTLHEGNIWKGSTIVHASSRHGRVVAMPWEDFVREAGTRYDGFLLYEYR